MPTVIDSLVVTLGLDPSNFTKGQKEAASALIKTKDEVRKQGKEIELSAKGLDQVFSGLRRNVMMLFAAFSAGKGLQSFAQDIIKTSAAVGRMANLMDASVSDLSKWQGIAAATGGSAQGVTSSINSLNQSMQELSLTGESSVIPYLRALQAQAPGVNLSLMGMNGQIRTAIDLLPDLHKAFQGMDAARAAAIGHGLGLSDDLINILIKSDKEFNKFMQDQQRWGTVTKEQAKATQDLQYQANGMYQAFETLGRMLIAEFGPYVTKALEWINDKLVYMQKHLGAIKVILISLAAVATALFIASMANPIGLAIIAIGALIAAAALLYDDWKTWNEGGKSVFGDFYQYVSDKWYELVAVAKKTWDDIKGYVMPVIDALKTIFEGFIQYMIGSLKLLYNIFFGNAEDIRKSWDEMVGGLKRMWHGFWDGLAPAILNAAPAIFSAVKKAIGAAFEWVIKRANAIWEAITGEKNKFSFENAPEAPGAPGPGTTGVTPTPLPPGSSPAALAGTMAGPGLGGVGAPAPPPTSGPAAPTLPPNRNRDAFIQKYYPAALEVSKETGIPVERILAQAGLESGWNINAPANNFFGIKAQGGYTGKSQVLGTTEADASGRLYSTQQRFRAYDKPEESFRDWAKLLDQKNFVAAKQAGLTDAQYAAILKQGGYATDPFYAQKLAATIAATKSVISKQNVGGGVPGATVGPAVPGAPQAALNQSTTQQQSSVSQTQNTHVAQLVVHTQATDAAGIAKDIKPALERDNFAMQSNYSLA